MIFDKIRGETRAPKTDFTWFLERLHRDGRWEMIHSKGKAVFDRRQNRSAARTTLIAAEDSFGDWDKTWLGILIGDYPIPGQTRPLANFGWPEDASDFVTQIYQGPMFAGSSHFTLGRLRDATRLRQAAPDDAAAACVTARLACLEKILTAQLPPMFGRMRDAQGGRPYPDIADASAHDRIAVAQRAAGLLPIGADTVRVLTG